MAHIRVFNHYFHYPYILLGVVEFLVLVVCAHLSVKLAYPDLLPVSQHVSVVSYEVVFAVVMLFSATAMGSYEPDAKAHLGSLLMRFIVSFCLLGCAIMVVIAYLLPAIGEMRGVLFGAVVLSIISILAIRKIFYYFVNKIELKRKVLVLGAGPKAESLYQQVVQDKTIACSLVGFISADHSDSVVNDKLLLDPEGGLLNLARRHRVDEIVVALDDRRRDAGGYFPLDELLDCKMSGVQISQVVNFYEREFGRIELNEIHPGWMVFGDGFRQSRSRDWVKRIFDISVSLVLLLLVWPIMLLAVVLVAMESGFPIVYKQIRVCFNGKTFPMYKFRSMVKDAESDGQARWAQKNDSRVTRVGAFMRNTRIDELPQIFNVLKGDMSFVGPRPERPEFVSELAKQLPYYDARHRVKPGLMGWAQLKLSLIHI